MAFCILGQDAVGSGFTPVDNAFLREYMPHAPEVALKIYLYGLCIATRQDDVNNVANMQRALSVNHDDIVDAFTYWEEYGLVNVISKNPLSVQYVDASSRNLQKKVAVGKYKTFNKKMQQALCGRMISVREYNEYYTFLENSFFEPDALVEIAKYCAEVKGNDIGYAYILKIARDWDAAGYKTLEKVREKMSTQNHYNEELTEVFKALGIKCGIDIDDRRTYQKWTEEMGFDSSVVKEIAKRNKRQSMTRLDSLLTEYYKQRLMSVNEIDVFEATKEQNKQLALEVNRAMGLYYSDLRAEIDEYVTSWLSKGFLPDTILLVAKFCFKCRIQTLEGLNQKLDSLAEKGLVSKEAIIEYTEDVLKTDNRIAKVLDALGIVRSVCAADRKNYKNWQSADIPFDVLLAVAKKCGECFNPMATLNKTVAAAKQSGAKDEQSILKLVCAPTEETKKDDKNKFLMPEDRTYSAEQLNAMFEQLSDQRQI